MREDIKKTVVFILNQINTNGLKWKAGKDLKHLSKRKEYRHIPNDFTLKDYENVILEIINGIESDLFIYYLKGFKKNYIVFGDGEWIVIIGEDGIMETSFPVEIGYFTYLSKEMGYEYIGKLGEVLK